jgi:DeoR/GlpR family transcriptional regulator of sugar metabolism
VGKITRICLDEIHYDKAFVGIDGYSTQTGFTLRDMLRAEISSHIIRKSPEVFIVTDSSKFGKTGLTSICLLSDVHHIATDNGLPDPYRAEFLRSGIDLILA